MTRKLLWIVAICGIAYGGLGLAGVPVEQYAATAWSWVRPDSAKLLGAVIVEESADRPKLPAEQVMALAAAPALGVVVVDQHVVGKGKQPAAELQPYLDAAKGKLLPQLVRKWGNGSVTSVDCPTTTELLKKAVGR